MKINKKYRLENMYQSFGLLLFFMINTEDYTEDIFVLCKSVHCNNILSQRNYHAYIYVILGPKTTVHILIMMYIS